ncbi:MAG: lysophospholipid acyltransferase family protein, partial [Planktomarina sp.]
MSDDRNQRYVVRIADTSDDMQAALALRAACFRQGADDRDAWDDLCTHIVVKDAGRVVCTFRTLLFKNGSDIANCYAAKCYDLSNLSNFPHPMIEVGRFCICPSITDPDVLRTAWAALTRMV